MTQSDEAKKWMAENKKAFECWNRHVKEHGLPLAQFNDLGREPEHNGDKRWLHAPEMKAKLARADAWMRANPPGPDVPIGAIKSFGLVGPKYEVGNPLRKLGDGDWMVEITLIESGEKTEYPLSSIKDDPEAP